MVGSCLKRSEDERTRGLFAIRHLPGVVHCPARMSAIETNGLTKVYRTYKKAPGLWGAVKGLGRREYEDTRAADGVTFSIEEGEFVGFLGPNGARARLRSVGAAR